MDYKEINKNCKEIRTYNELSPHKLALGLIKPNSMVLTIGCGDGREVEYLVKKLHCTVVALDIDKEMIEASRKKQPLVTYHCMNAKDYVREHSFDYIVCLWNTINYLSPEERRKLIIKSYLNLKRGGALILTTSHIFQNWRFIFHNLKSKTNYYYFPGEIKKWFEGLDFKVDKIKVKHSGLIIARKGR